MSDPISLINFGELAQPATTLIEKISDAIGGIFRPYQIRRVTEAEADASIIMASTEIEISDLQQRALYRFFIEEANKQNNIEEITKKALPEVIEQAEPERIEDDWITNFFDKCRLISDEDMQFLWARILSGEANSPSTFSKRTVNLLSNLDKSDAFLLTNICNVAIRIDDRTTPLIYDIDHKFFTDSKITYENLAHLESIGLIRFDNLQHFTLGVFDTIPIPIHYFNDKFLIETPNNDINIGKVILTQSGNQLSSICNAQPQDGFIEYVLSEWVKLGYKTST